MKTLSRFSSWLVCAGVVGLGLSSGAVEKPVAGATKVVDGLAVTVQPAKAAFAADERIALTITVKNTTKEVVRLNASQYLGSTSFGRYGFQITDAKGAKWELIRNLRARLPGAPVRLIPVNLKPGQSFAAKTHLPSIGMLFRQAGRQRAAARGVRFLPIGKYKLAISMKLLKTAFTTAPVTFGIRPVPKVTDLPGGLPKAKIVAAARVFFAKRLGQFQAANRGKKFWDGLAAKQFEPRITAAGRYWSVRFDKEIQSSAGKQVMGMVIQLDGKGKVINPNLPFGFYPDKNAPRPQLQINLPVRGVPSKPLKPRRK